MEKYGENDRTIISHQTNNLSNNDSGFNKGGPTLDRADEGSFHMDVWDIITVIVFDGIIYLSFKLPPLIYVWMIIVALEIEERLQFLEEMKALGQGDKYEPIIRLQVAQVLSIY